MNRNVTRSGNKHSLKQLKQFTKCSRSMMPSQQEINVLAELFAQKRYAEAEESALKITANYPGHGIGWKALGTALKLQGKNAEALQAFQKAVTLMPDDAEAHKNLAITLKDMGRLVEAETSFCNAIKARPEYAEPYYESGILFQALNRDDEAEARYRHAIRLKPDYADAHNNLGAVLWNMGRLAEAEAVCKQALQTKPEFAEAYNNLGNIYSSSGRTGEAIACYTKAMTLRPHWALLYFNLHPLLLNGDNITAAIQCLTKAVSLEPSNPEYRFSLGMILDYTGNPEVAAGHFEMVKKSTELCRARLDAWHYIKSARTQPLHITGYALQTFKLGIENAAIEGLVLEFGVRFGASIRQIAALAEQEVHGFDSFEGLPEQWHHEPQGIYSTKGKLPEVPDSVTLHVGWFEDTIPAFIQKHSGPIRFMNIDCDIYSSTKTIFDLFSDRIIPGTVIVFDEYIGNAHWREDEFKAFQEAVAKYGWSYEYLAFSFFTKQVLVKITQAT